VTIVANDVGAVGGMERQLAELAGGLSRLGHEVTVIARTCQLPERERREAMIRFHRVWGPRRPFLLAYPWFLLAGSLVLRRRRRGIVQATGAVVLNRVDVLAVHCCHQVYRAVPGSQTLPARFHAALVSAVKRAVERLCLAINRSATLVCVSEGVAAEVRAYYPDAAWRVMRIHNGVDLDRFAPGAHAAPARELRRTLGIDPHRLVLAFVGGNWEHKGLRQLLRALAQAGEWDLVVAGRGNLARFRELAEELEVAERVHWLGVVPDIEVVYGLADAFALPSGYETFSLVTFEAAASGLAILATPVSGVRELIEDGRSGYLIPADPEAIAQCLRELGADPQLRARLGAAARAAAGAFGWEEMVREHHHLYAGLTVGVDG
jgi:UDP-glucose:(heptosyl)LPS alpha-1,3-glucosyltransferase